ncbi:MAG TPA: prephenate dehydrogenase/arogenate dehydrogenase family protein, partial [Alphaproteobacteria bacterium]|nr:prephenate dehydrogenase/arogenate dehydrogenase family protein [Alphaproteobacteria bacterium]
MAKATAKRRTAAKPGALFNKVAIIGIGHIGASLALGMRARGVARRIVAGDKNARHVAVAIKKKIVDEASTQLSRAVKDADLVVLCTPVSAMGPVMKAIGPHLKRGAILSDVGSVKQGVIDAVKEYLPKSVHFVPAHPIAGTEFSGPLAGLADLFEGHWCVITPLKGADKSAVKKVSDLWKRLGSQVKIMEARHHDKVLAITSHLPHLIA